MKIFFRMIVLFYILFNSHIYAKNEIIIANGEWPPFFSKELENFGVTSHIVSKIFEEQNIQTTYKWYPWKRAYHLAKSGVFNAVIGWSKTKDREKFFLFSEPILEGNVVFFHLKNKEFKWNRIDELKNLKIGTITGYTYKNKIKELKQNKFIKVHEVINEIKLFDLLLKKRFDVVIINQDAGFGILSKFFSEEEKKNITYNKKTFHQEHLRLLFNKHQKQNEQYLYQFDLGLKKLKESGEFYRIYEKAKREYYRINSSN